nr:tyrosine-type recombinase/integrase [Magnetospirillum aberrantis]
MRWRITRRLVLRHPQEPDDAWRPLSRHCRRQNLRGGVAPAVHRWSGRGRHHARTGGPGAPHRGPRIQSIATDDRSRRNGEWEFNERVALFDLHSLRVSGITALIEAGLPPHFVQEIIGHAAIVMTLYYHKIHPGKINRALNEAFESRELSLERIPEVLADLDGYDAFLLNSRAVEDTLGREMLCSAIGSGTYQVFSHGICPAGDCRTGGEYSHLKKEHDAVPRAGACSLCRYRLTGPMFLVGLVVNANKIMAELHGKGQEIARLNDEIRHRRREGKAITSFQARRELLHRELEDLWMEWASEHQYVQDSARLLRNYLHYRDGDARLPVLAAEGALRQLAVKAERRHPFHLNQLLAEASAYVPSERHGQAIGERDAFLNELLANNDIDPFLLRLPCDARLTNSEWGHCIGSSRPAMPWRRPARSSHSATSRPIARRPLAKALMLSPCLTIRPCGLMWKHVGPRRMADDAADPARRLIRMSNPLQPPICAAECECWSRIIG